MNAREAEALEYPSAHRDRALELMRRREALTAALAGIPSGEISKKATRRAQITATVVIPLALLSVIGSMTGLVPSRSANIFSLILIACSLTVFIIVARDEQKRLRRDRIDIALQLTHLELDALRDDYTTTEDHSGRSDRAMAATLEPDGQEISNKAVLITATIALIGTLAALVWMCAEALMA